MKRKLIIFGIIIIAIGYWGFAFSASTADVFPSGNSIVIENLDNERTVITDKEIVKTVVDDSLDNDYKQVPFFHIHDADDPDYRIYVGNDMDEELDSSDGFCYFSIKDGIVYVTVNDRLYENKNIDLCSQST